MYYVQVTQRLQHKLSEHINSENRRFIICYEIRYSVARRKLQLLCSRVAPPFKSLICTFNHTTTLLWGALWYIKWFSINHVLVETNHKWFNTTLFAMYDILYHHGYYVTGTAFAILCYLQYFPSPFGAHVTSNNEQSNDIELTSVTVSTII